MSLHRQLEEAAGLEIPVFYPEGIAALLEQPVKEAMRTLERNSRVLPIRDFLAGKISFSGPLLIVVRDCRDGLLLQLVEGLAGQKS